MNWFLYNIKGMMKDWKVSVPALLGEIMTPVAFSPIGGFWLSIIIYTSAVLLGLSIASLCMGKQLDVSDWLVNDIIRYAHNGEIVKEEDI